MRSVELLNYFNSIMIVTLPSTTLLVAFFFFLYQHKRQPFLLAWSVAWLLLLMHLIARILGVSVTAEPWTRWLGDLNEWFLMLAALAFYCAARLYARLTIPLWALTVGAAAGTAWAVADAYAVVNVPVVLGVGLVFFLVGNTFLQEGRKQEAITDVLLAVTFVVWGLLYIAEAFTSHLTLLQGVDLAPLMVSPGLFTCVLMVMAVYEEEGRRVERNMLAISNLNLATSGFAGSGIQTTLSQALLRVLTVVRIPVGALCMRHDESSGLTPMTATGFDDAFRRAVGEGDLGEYIVYLVARLGGLVVLRDLASDANWERLDAEAPFRQLRQLLVGQRLRTLIGISLQAKDGVFGALMLATRDNRSFTPAELRLLLALGHQIGMALENSSVVQRTARRAEELRILNDTDSLTRVKSRSFVEEELSAEWKRSTAGNRVFSVAMIDLDNFKNVNDLCGHPEGDKVLERVGRILIGNSPSHHTVGRYGGDEFIILSPGFDTQQSYQLADKLRSSLAVDEFLKERKITGSFGVASFPQHGAGFKEVLQAADDCVYVSKRAGGNRVSCPGGSADMSVGS